MARTVLLLSGLLAGGWGAFIPAAALADIHLSDLPPGPGRETVFIKCAACHSLRIVLQQRLSRDVWDEVLVWMKEEQSMPKLDPELRELILDYLSTHFSPDKPR